MSFVNGIRFTDGKKNRHDDDMEFDQVVFGIRRYLKTLDRNTKRFGKTKMKISRRS